MQEFEVLFYDKPDGTEPAKDFLDSLDVKMRAKMVKEIELLSVNGTELREPYSKYIGLNCAQRSEVIFPVFSIFSLLATRLS